MLGVTALYLVLYCIAFKNHNKQQTEVAFYLLLYRILEFQNHHNQQTGMIGAIAFYLVL